MTKRILLAFAAVVSLIAVNSWADDKPAASTTPAAKTDAKPAATSAKGDSPTVTAMKAAIALAEAGKTDEAVAAYEKMGVLKSKNMEAWRLNNEGLAYLMANKVDKATPLFEKATQTNDKNYVAWNNLGSCYEQDNKLDEAKDAYQKSVDAAKDAGVSNAKAEGNLAALEARMEKMGKGSKADDKPDADDKDGGDKK